eukprot:TRINITY_DN13063_c0_g1_i9.p1 TRINITY_DN13063_c0_g1~~TRINITY_DN13063_c0_g1_i9.p1  ORF type:complete len:617 (-),score=104.59 TRINITY_DN13063_c0_g1_i9:13-1863(-)
MDSAASRNELNQLFLRSILTEMRYLGENIQREVSSEFRKLVATHLACTPMTLRDAGRPQSGLSASGDWGSSSWSGDHAEYPLKPSSLNSSGEDFTSFDTARVVALPGSFEEVCRDVKTPQAALIGKSVGYETETSRARRPLVHKSTEGIPQPSDRATIQGTRDSKHSQDPSECKSSALALEIEQATRELRMDTRKQSGAEIRANIRDRASEWLRSAYFDYFMSIFLLLNLALVGVQTNYMANHANQPVPSWIVAINVSFCLIFSIELGIRIAISGTRFWSNDGYKWNVFDTIIVTFTILDEVSQSLMSGSDVQEIIDQMGILRMLRVARVARLIRMVRLIPELKSLVYLILSSMGAFIWTLVLMLILMFCVAVYFTQIATDMRAQKEVPPDIDVIVRYWGTIENSIMSLFMAITGGDDWRNLSEVFLNKPGSLTNQLFFSCYIAWASLVMLNLVTGVFVEGAQRIVGEDRRKETVRLAAKFFVEADLDNSEELTLHEFEALVGCGKMDEFLSGLGISVNDANALFQSFDEDGSGDISLVEFVEGCLRLGATSTYQDTMILKCNQMALTNKVEEFSSSVEALSKRSAQLNDLLRFVVSGGRSGRLPLDMLPLSEEVV